MSNPMDSRNRGAFEIVTDLRKSREFKLAVLGSHNVDAKALAEVLDAAVVEALGEKPGHIVTGCAPVGVEKAARLAAKGITGHPVVVFHRADMVYGPRDAEKMRDVLLAQEADALLLVGSGKVCKHARELFEARGKLVYDVEIE